MADLYTKTSSGVERIDVSVPKIEERVTNLENNKLGKTEKATSALVADSANSIEGANVKGTVANATNAVNATNATTATSATSASSVPWTGITNKPNFATVATTGSYNDLTDKPAMSSSPKAYITQTYHSGSEWYRVWSNGFIEQGGIAWGTNGLTRITFKKPFSNTNYHVSPTLVAAPDDRGGTLGSKYTQKETSFVVLRCTWEFQTGGYSIDAPNLTWYACGY